MATTMPVPIASANRIDLLSVKETNYGVIPNTPTMKKMRLNSESLRQETQTVDSQEIRSDGQISDVVRTLVTAAGDISFEASASGSMDDFLQSATRAATWASPTSLTSLTLTFNAAAGTITRSAGSWITDGVVAGSWVLPSGVVNSINNSVYKVASLTATVLTVDPKTTAFMADETSTAGCSVKIGGTMVNGLDLTTFALERIYNDLTNEFARYLGMGVNTFSLQSQNGQITSGSVNFMGTQELSASATAASVVTAQPTGAPFSSVDDVDVVTDLAWMQDTTTFNLSLASNLRYQTRQGQNGPFGLALGTFNASGSFDAFYKSKAIMDKYLTFASVPIFKSFLKGGVGYIFEFPACRFTSGQRVGGGLNQDIMARMQWRAFRDSVSGVTARITRF